MAVQLSKGKMSTNQIIKWFIAIGIPLACLCLPTTWQMRFFACFTIWMILTVAFDLMHMFIPCVLCPILYVVFQVAPPAVAYGAWASPIVSMSFCSIIFANALAESGLMNRLAYKALSRVGGSTAAIVWGVFAVCMGLSVVTFGNIGYILAALCFGVCKALDLGNNKLASVIMMAGMYGNLTCLLFLYNPTTVPIVLASAHAVAPGLNVQWYDFLYANWPLIIFSILFNFVLVKFYLGKSKNSTESDLGNKGAAYFTEQYAQMGKMSHQEKMAALWISLLVIYIITNPIHHLDTMWGFILVGAFSIMPRIGAGTIQSVKGADVGFIFFVAACIGIGIVATSLGLNNVLISGAQPIIQSFGAGTLFIITLIFGIVANLVVTPLTILTALAAPMAQLAINFGFDPKASLFVLIFSEFLIILPYETMPSLVWFAFGACSTGHFFKIGLMRIILFILFFIIAVLPWWKFIGLI